MPPLRRLLPVVLLGAHVLLVAGYTAPERWVPPLWRAWSMAVVRPLFHQGWDLFAPDPPRCSCTLEARSASGSWRSFAAEGDGLLARRMARHLVAYLGGGAVLPDTVQVPPQWAPAVRSMLGDARGPDGSASVRAVQRCMDDPARPLERSTRHVTLVFATTPAP
ncbi:MAG TPA: hypothetical protein PKE21_09895 [Flavobacteriales bacterium]|nr:hypothetical protein [Flavobacteriales bacterium]HMR27777.1 hypothetical protein [Flavobacteriales bacterium]